MIDTIKFLYELLLKLLEIRGKRRREVFSEVLEPLFDRYIQIHSSYRQLFNSTIYAL